MENENITPVEPQSTVPSVTPPAVAPKTNAPMGALIGTIIIIVILILGGAYLWSTKVQPQINPEPADQTAKNTQDTNNVTTLEQTAGASDPMIDQLKSQSPSDEIASIQSDLNATDLTALDKELQSI